MKKTFLIVTVDNRIEGFKKLIRSIAERKDLNDWSFLAVTQSYTNDQITDMDSFFEECGVAERMTIYHLAEQIGPNKARIKALEKAKSDIWCNFDDDMWLIDEFNIEPAVEKLIKDKEVGFVSLGWVKSESMIKSRPIRDEFKEQAIVYTGGGLLYRSDVAKIIMDTCTEEYLFDNPEWSINSYIRGYKNYRYLGSLTIHKIVSVGGRRGWVGRKNRTLPDSRYFNLESTKNEIYHETDNNYKIPTSANLTKEAKVIHKIENGKMKKKGALYG